MHGSSKTTQNNFWRTMAPPKYRISGCMLSLRPNCRRFDEDAVLRYREMKSCCSQARGQKARDVRRYFSCIFERLTQVRKLSLKEAGFRPHIQRKGRKNHPLSAWEKQGNRTRARIRSRVEHIFGAQLQRAGTLVVRSIGLVRARVKIGLRNLAYNMDRLGFLVGA